MNMPNTKLSFIPTNLTQLILNSLAISVRNSNYYGHGFAEWKLADVAVERAEVVVAKDGSGDFKMVQEAVNAACNRRPPGGRYEVHVKVGIYKENVVIPKTVRYVKMFGDGINKTVITGNQHSGGDMLETPLAGDMKDSTTFSKLLFLVLVFRVNINIALKTFGICFKISFIFFCAFKGHKLEFFGFKWSFSGCAGHSCPVYTPHSP